MKRLLFLTCVMPLLLTPSATPQKKNTAAPDSAVGRTKDGQTIYLGPRGGRYRLNSKGTRVYLSAEEKKGGVSSTPAAERKDKVVGKTDDGQPVYEGPRGGRYYLNDKGAKVYMKSKRAKSGK
jgi:hypothetical protein